SPANSEAWSRGLLKQEVPRSRGCSWSIHRLSYTREDYELFPLFCLLSLAGQLYPQNCPTHRFWTGDSLVMQFWPCQKATQCLFQEQDSLSQKPPAS
ncbi:hypothetical protein LEMLEM_LOCUS24825, partial [Lemmus lemmus]